MDEILTEKELKTVAEAVAIHARVETYCRKLESELIEYGKNPDDPEKCKKTADDLHSALCRVNSTGTIRVGARPPVFCWMGDKACRDKRIDAMSEFKKDLDTALSSSPGIAARAEDSPYFANNALTNMYFGMIRGDLVVVRQCKRADCRNFKKLLKAGGFSYTRCVKYDTEDFATYEIRRAKP